MTDSPASVEIEFSRPVSTAGIVEEEAVFLIEADAAECKALAKRFGLRALHSLKAELRLRPMEEGEICLEGHLTAEAVQTCVVSLADFAASLDERFALRFSPEAEPLSEVREILLAIEANDPPEPLEGEKLDLGEIVAEHFALALNPYPRLPGVDLADFVGEAVEKQEISSPFARLGALKGEK